MRVSQMYVLGFVCFPVAVLGCGCFHIPAV